MELRRICCIVAMGMVAASVIVHAQPFEVRPGEGVDFQLCFYWEDLPGQPPASGVFVVTQPEVFSMSGYHWHDDASRPQGSIQPSSFTTSGDGCSPTLRFSAPIVAGMHPISIYAAASYVTQEIWVAAWANNGNCCYQLYENQDLYYKPSGAQPEHPDWYGFNVSLQTAAKTQTIAQQYRQQTGQQLCVNDMSLNWGGVFDLGPRYSGQYWQSPHAEHRLGLNVDLPFSCNNNLQTMYNIALANGGGAGPGGILVHSDHYHLRFVD
jgi:hypothetical protein